MSDAMPKHSTRGGRVRTLALLLGTAALLSCSQTEQAAAPEDGTLLFGHITSETGEPLMGVPVRARGAGDNFSVVVYSDRNGDYSFPSWSDLGSGVHTVSITLPDFELAKEENISLADGTSTELDFDLIPRTPDVFDATAAEILAALPGTDHEKVLFSQCSNCHTLQRALRFEYDQTGWAEIIKLMAGRRNVERDFPDSYTFGQQRFVDTLAHYIASIRGPGSSDQIPFELRPRPTTDESTKLVLTEYDLPRGGQFEIDMLRGAQPYVWPHDVVVDDNYAWYTDHFSNALGRVDKRTGEATEIAYPIPPGGGRDTNVAPGEVRAGNPGGGSHDLQFDSHGNLIIGMDGATVRYNPQTEVFDNFLSGNNMFGLGPDDHIWHTDDGGPLMEVDLTTGAITEHAIPTNSGVYDMDTDSQGRTIINIWRNNRIGVYDPSTDTYKDYEIPTRESGPRRGEIDAQDNLWTTLYYSGQIVRFDPNTGDIREYNLVPGSEPYEAPYAAPYSLSVDDENGWVWTNDFNANRLYRIDIESGESIEYFLPDRYVLRDLTVEEGTERPTVWLPSYRPPSQIVKVQVR
jgi:virginiamycin B lyase